MSANHNANQQGKYSHEEYLEAAILCLRDDEFQLIDDYFIQSGIITGYEFIIAALESDLIKSKKVYRTITEPEVSKLTSENLKGLGNLASQKI